MPVTVAAGSSAEPTDIGDQIRQETASRIEDLQKRIEEDRERSLNAALEEIRALKERIVQLESRMESAAAATGGEVLGQGVTPPPATSSQIFEDAIGNVGLGISAPTHRLHLNGGIRIHGATPVVIPTSGCGDGASVTGNNSVGRVDLGSSAGNYCKIAFADPNPFTAPPICTASGTNQCKTGVTIGGITTAGFFIHPGDITTNFESDCGVSFICIQSDPPRRAYRSIEE
jgi:hypothetical protein